MRRGAVLLCLCCPAAVAQAPPPIPPIADADRIQSYNITSSTAQIAIGFPVFGDCTDISVNIAGGVQPLSSGFWNCASQSGTALSLLPLPVTDMVVNFTPPLTSGTLVISGAWHPRNLTVPAAPGITRREFAQAISMLIAGQREQTAQINGILTGGIPVRLFSAKTGGDTNNSSSGSGADFDHNLTFAIPANFMTANRVFLVTAHYRLTTGSAPPNFSHKLKLGSITLLGSALFTPGASMTNVQTAFQWVFQATAAPGASVNVECSPIGSLNSVGLVQTGATAMPVAIATNAVQTVKVSTQWSAVGTGTSTISLQQLIVEQLN